MRIRCERAAGILLQEIAEGGFGERVVLALHVADAKVVFVLRRGARRQGCNLRSGGLARSHVRDIARNNRRARSSQIKRRAWRPNALGADRRIGLEHGRRRRCWDRLATAPKGARRADRIRVLCRIEHVGTAPAGRRRLDDRRAGLRRSHRRRGHRRCRRARRRTRTGGRRSNRHAATGARELLLELLVAELQLLDRAGELADLAFKLIDAHRLLGGDVGLLAARRLAAAEQAFEQAAILRERIAGGEKHAGGKSRHAQIV